MCEKTYVKPEPIPRPMLSRTPLCSMSSEISRCNKIFYVVHVEVEIEGR